MGKNKNINFLSHLFILGSPTQARLVKEGIVLILLNLPRMIKRSYQVNGCQGGHNFTRQLRQGAPLFVCFWKGDKFRFEIFYMTAR